MAINTLRAGALGFTLVASAISFNALFLQREHLPKRQPIAQAAKVAKPRLPAESLQPERTVTIVGPQGWLRLAEMRPNSANMRVSAGNPANGHRDRSTVAAIQRELIARGYKPGSNDGSVDISTRAAIMAFEHDNALPLSAEPSAELLKSLVMGAVALSPTRVRREAVDPVASNRIAEIVRFVQLRLNTENYQPGPVDGVLGSATVRAIREYELDHRMKPTGRISGALVESLRSGRSRVAGG